MIERLITIIPNSLAFERIWTLARVEFKLRYYGSTLGVLWAFLNPLFQLIILYTFFTVVFPSRISYFPLYLFLGLLIHMFFAESTSKGMGLFGQYRYIIENVEINKIDLFLASLLSTFMGFVFNLGMYILFSMFFSINYTIYILYFPVILGILCLFILALSFMLSTLKLYLRDLNHIWDIVLLVLFYGTPIFYDERILYDHARWYYYAYPMVGIVSNARKILIDATAPDFTILSINLIISLLLFIVCYRILLKYSKRALEIL